MVLLRSTTWLLFAISVFWTQVLAAEELWRGSVNGEALVITDKGIEKNGKTISARSLSAKNYCIFSYRRFGNEPLLSEKADFNMRVYQKGQWGFGTIGMKRFFEFCNQTIILVFCDEVNSILLKIYDLVTRLSLMFGLTI